MPMPATSIPDGAVAGEDIRWSPYMKRKAAVRSARPIVSCGIMVSISVPQPFFARWVFA